MSKFAVPYFNSPDAHRPTFDDVFGIDQFKERREATDIFAYHRCWKCDDGARPCVNGSPNRCDFPRARDE